jgi:hypothetical protein
VGQFGLLLGPLQKLRWAEPLGRLRRTAINLPHDHVTVQVHIDAQLDHAIGSRALFRGASGCDHAAAHDRIHQLFGLLVDLGQQSFHLVRLELGPKLRGRRWLRRAGRPALGQGFCDFRPNWSQGLGRTFLLARVLGFGFGFVSFFHCVVRLSNFSQPDHPMLSFDPFLTPFRENTVKRLHLLKMLLKNPTLVTRINTIN